MESFLGSLRHPHRGRWWAMVDEVTVSERRDTIQETASLFGRAAYVLDLFVRGAVRFEVVQLNWDVDVGCLRGELIRKRTKGVATEEVGRSSESGVKVRLDDKLHIRYQYLI